MTNDDVQKSPQSIWSILISAGAILSALILVLGFAHLTSALDCKGYVLVKLAYPILFGAIGVILGGKVDMRGRGRLFGFPWTGHVTGGVGAAVLGFGIAWKSEPVDCAPRHALAVLDWPVKEPGDMPRYYTTVEYDPGVQVWIENVRGNKYDYVFNFPGTSPVQIRFKIYQRLDNGTYKALPGCILEIQNSSPLRSDSQIVYKLRQDRDRYQLKFDSGYFRRLESASGQSDANGLRTCLTGVGILAEHQSGAPQNVPGQIPIVGPLYFVANGSALGGFMGSTQPSMLVEARKVSADPRDLAREPEVERLPEPPAPKVIAQTEDRKAIPLPSVAVTPPVPRLPGAKKCAISEDSKSAVDAFLAGDDLDYKRRQDLYKSWIGPIHCYVWEMVEFGQSSPTLQARAVRLLNFALKNVDNYYWQISSKRRRDFQKDPLPLLKSDFGILFALAQSDDDQVRGEAVALIRYYPVDSFERLFRAAPLNAISGRKREWLAIAASFMYYNRITETLSDAADKAGVRRIISDEYDRAQKWVADDLFADRNGKPYRAMLLYSKAAVERWGLEEGGVDNFTTMLDVLRATGGAYPQRYHHIAQALAIVSGGSRTQQIFDLLKSAVDYPAATFLESDSSFSEPSYAMFAGPTDQYARLSVRLDSKQGARMLLRSGDWVLVHAKGRIGWIRRPSST